MVRRDGGRARRRAVEQAREANRPVPTTVCMLELTWRQYSAARDTDAPQVEGVALSEPQMLGAVRDTASSLFAWTYLVRARLTPAGFAALRLAGVAVCPDSEWRRG